jgi:signal transduction histidine kinase
MRHDQDPLPSPVPLDSVIITAELARRPPRESDLQQENEAFRKLADFIATAPETFLDRLVEVTAVLCAADTVGISIEETDAAGNRIFRWIAMAGELKHLIGGTTPRDFSPCGVCVDTNRPLLMSGLARYYPQFRQAPRPFVEALLLPWGIKGGPIGTLWIVAHTEQRKFDMQDVRLMNGLAAFACGSLLLREKIRDGERAAAASSMITEMAHHINNPLQAAVLAIYRLKSESALHPEARDLVTVLETQLNRVAEMSSGLLAGDPHSGGQAA